MPQPQSKPFEIPKPMVWEAYRRVAANKGAAGVDGDDLVMDVRLGEYPIEYLQLFGFGVATVGREIETHFADVLGAQGTWGTTGTLPAAITLYCIFSQNL